MSIPEEKKYPRSGDMQTIYLRSVINNPNIKVGACTIYHEFVNDPIDLKKIMFCIIFQ